MLLWVIATLAAFFVKGLCGFANTLVFTSILSFGAANVSISPVELLLGYPSNLIMAWRERRAIRWEICLPLAALVLLGSIPGALFLKNSDTKSIKAIFGAVIVLISLEMLLRGHLPQKHAPSKWVFAVIGVLSGVLCGLYGVGALLGAYMSRVTEDSSTFRANLCVVFLVENTLRIALYAVWGILNFSALRSAAALLPVMLAGLALGVKSGSILNEVAVKKVVVVMLLLSGTALLVQNVV